MNIDKMEFEFLIKAILGHELDLKNNHQNSENIITSCIARADRDMITAGRNYLKPNRKEERRDALKNLLEKCNYSFSINLIIDFSFVIENQKKNIEDKVSFGLAQKMINMCFKYFYVLRYYLDKNIDFSKCDCPIDSIILDELGEKDIIWSHIDQDNYNRIQEAIDSRLNEDSRNMVSEELHKEINRLLFDFIYWK